MSGLDGVFLHLETSATPMHVAALYLIEPAADRDRDVDFAGEIERQLLPRLALAPFFRARLAPMPLQFANPVWIDGGLPEFSYHLRHIVLPAAASFADLEACVSGLHSTPLDRRYPLWEVAIIEGLASGEIGLYLKIHHAALDGVSGMALAGTLFDATAEPAEVPADWRQQVGEAEDPGLGQRLGAIFRHTAAQYLKLARHLPAGLQLLTGMVRSAGQGRAPGMGQNLSFGPKTPLNVPIGAGRGFAALSLSLAGVKEIARRHEATVNDVVLALCSGALRRYLQAQGGLPRKSLIATMPVSLRAEGNTETTIQATLTLVRLATHLADPLRRLHAVHAAAGAAKALTRRAQSIIPTDFPSLGIPWVVGGLAALYGRSGVAKVLPPLANLAISNVPGPRQPLYIAGGRIRACWPLSIVEHGLGLNITVFSYCDSLDFGLTVARDAVPDVAVLAQALTAAYAELEQLPATAVADGPAKMHGPGESVVRKPAAEASTARARAARPAAHKKTST
ncbi:wax ester/triacylglycerol synthase family O-acyltransferase [Accumulibacter sp.]|uniref:wax ester/triacylglycerol synthase family O-acyltransferase n=1 Tax=Accumulibacter sp. TaxID=2053492 RepID=UPI001A428086|nr:wax ester/triacylglycerol synthase family O-acyltransferase [Accumulibacter sp.]MBL8374388.1 wax ester/triacylglycerol synthase family O-acyltransferase [Accumulibacter sp.]